MRGVGSEGDVWVGVLVVAGWEFGVWELDDLSAGSVGWLHERGQDGLFTSEDRQWWDVWMVKFD